MFKATEYYNTELKIKTIDETKDSVLLEDEKQESSMTFYHIMPGIDLVFNRFTTIECCKPEFNRYTMEMIEINYCKMGRFGCTIDGNKNVYLGEGEIEANIMGITRNNPEFPLGFYFGIEILIDPNIAIGYLESVFPEIAKQIKNLKEFLLKNNMAVLIKKMPELQHIFDELYNIKESIKNTYMKLKVLEILLMLQGIPFDRSIRESKYYNKKDIDKVQEIHNEIIHNLDKKITLNQLSEKYNMNITYLKECFKEVYGKPYYSYLKYYKMHKAVHYLKETTLSISEIGGKLGYDNPSKFIEAFKSITNCTPREYRNNNFFLEHLELFGVEIES